MNSAGGCGPRDPNGEDAVDPKKLKKRENQSKSRAKIKNEGQRMKERLVETERITAYLRGQNLWRTGQVASIRRLAGSRCEPVEITVSYGTPNHSPAATDDSPVATDNLEVTTTATANPTGGVAKPLMINDDLARGHTITGVDFQAQHDLTIVEVLDNLGTPNQENNPKPLQDLWHHQVLQSPSMSDLDNIDIGSNIELSDFNPDGYFLLEDGLQTLLKSPTLPTCSSW